MIRIAVCFLYFIVLLLASKNLIQVEINASLKSLATNMKEFDQIILKNKALLHIKESLDISLPEYPSDNQRAIEYAKFLKVTFDKLSTIKPAADEFKSVIEDVALKYWAARIATFNNYLIELDKQLGIPGIDQTANLKAVEDLSTILVPIYPSPFFAPIKLERQAKLSQIEIIPKNAPANKVAEAGGTVGPLAVKLKQSVLYKIKNDGIFKKLRLQGVIDAILAIWTTWNDVKSQVLVYEDFLEELAKAFQEYIKSASSKEPVKEGLKLIIDFEGTLLQRLLLSLKDDQPKSQHVAVFSDIKTLKIYLFYKTIYKIIREAKFDPSQMFREIGSEQRLVVLKMGVDFITNSSTPTPTKLALAELLRIYLVQSKDGKLINSLIQDLLKNPQGKNSPFNTVILKQFSNYFEIDKIEDSIAKAQ